MAQYTSSFTMSLSGTTGSVQGVYTNTDHTRSFVLLKFNDVTNIPVKADKYQLFLSGCDRNQNYDKIKSNPDAQIYMFGSTGYMGIYLYSAEPFPSQILNLYLRSLVNFSGTSSTTGHDDETFNQYDQARIYFNPGGSYATKADFLDEDDWTIFDIYEELVSRPAEKSIRTLLRNDLKDMLNQKLLMDEYTNRIVDDGLMEPAMPSAIAGDVIYGKTIDGSSNEKLQWSIKKNQWYAPEALIGFEENNVHVYLDTKVVEPNGFNFVWQDSQIKNGYLKNLTGSDSLSDWKAYINQNDDADSTFNLDDVVWTYKDGTIFVPDADADVEGSTSKEQTLSAEVTQLKDAWQAFYDAKVDYQTVQLKALLQLEYDSRDIETSYSINANESGNLLTLW